MKVENSVKNKNTMVPIKAALARFIKAEMAKKSFKYKDLQDKLKAQEIDLSEANLRGKINKGLIPADLLIMILVALEVETFELKDVMELAKNYD